MIISFFFVSYRLLFASRVNSIFDPIYFFIIFTNSICSANVIFLSFQNEISNYYIFSYFASEVALILGFILISKPQRDFENSAAEPFFLKKIDISLILTFLLVVASCIIIYTERGVPLFMDVRGDASSGGSGFGIIARIYQVSSMMFVLLYFSKLKLVDGKVSLAEKIMMSCNFIFGIMSGYKAFFIFYAFSFFITSGKNGLPKRRSEFILVGIGTILMVILFILTTGVVGIESAIISFLTRIVASGDVYYMAFVNDRLYELPSNSFLFQMLGPTLASFRIIPWDNDIINYGIAINELVNMNDLNLGPTFRYNVLFMLFAKNIILSSALSLIVGLLIGSANRLVNKFRRINSRFIFCSFLYYKMFLLILGPDQAVVDISTSILIYFFISSSISLLVMTKFRSMQLISR